MKATFDPSPANARLRLGLLGCSRIANRIIHAAPSSNKIVISAIASRSLAKATDVLLRLPGAIAFDNYEDIIASKEVDAIYISIPNSMHFEWALKAIRRGKHVLVEKPAAMQLAELEELAFEAKKAGVIVMEAMWYRYHAQIKFLREQRLSGALGKLKAVSANFCFKTSDPNDIRWSVDLGGGVIADLFCYHADLLTHVLGIHQADIAFLEAFARFRNEVPASVFVEIKTTSDTIINLAASIERSSPNLTTLIYERGSCIAPNLRAFPEIGEIKLQFAGFEPGLKSFAWENAYTNMLDAFAGGVCGEHEQLVSLEDSIANLRFMHNVEAACQLEMADRTALIPKLSSKMAQLRQKFFGASAR
jgi:predicted dehydrogenase